MKSMNGKDLLRGDPVIYGVGGEIITGKIHEFYDRNEQVRISGYPLPVYSKDVVLAKDCWDTFVAAQPKPAPVPPPVPSLADQQLAAAQAAADAKK